MYIVQMFMRILTYWIFKLQALHQLMVQNVHYVNTIGHCIITNTIYEDINLLDLEAPGPPQLTVQKPICDSKL